MLTFSDTPQSPPIQDDSNAELSSANHPSPLIALDIENFIQKLNDNSLESRLQICSLWSISNLPNQRYLTVSFCIDTLIYLYENYSSNKQQETILTITSDYCFLPCSYIVLFDHILDIVLQNLPPTLILLQMEQENLSLSSTKIIYPKNLIHTLTPKSIRYIYDQKLLGQLLKYIQTTTTNERRWLINNSNKNKRKLNDNDDNKLTDEQFIEKIIQHVNHITQWTNEQRRHAIYSYIVDERQVLLQSL